MYRKVSLEDANVVLLKVSPYLFDPGKQTFNERLYLEFHQD